MIIGISGKIGSGKDTVANIITNLIADKLQRAETGEVNYYDYPANAAMCDWEVKRFAYKLKKIVAILTGCNVADLESQEFKSSYLPDIWNVREAVLDEISPRQLCIDLGFGDLFNPVGKALSKEAFQQFQEDKLKFYKKAKEEGWSLTGRLFTRGRTIDKRFTYREVLQRVGTEAMRGQLHTQVWVNALFAEYRGYIHFMCDRCGSDDIEDLVENHCPNCKGAESEGDITKVFQDPPNWLIADLRFPNELSAIKDRGGITLRVNRTLEHQVVARTNKKANATLFTEEDTDKSTFDKLRKFDNHPSEIALDKAPFDYVITNDGTLEELKEKVKQLLIELKLL